MKLYFSPLACSLATRIALYEAGLEAVYEQVTLATKQTKAGGDFWGISPKGQVPALDLGDGRILTEGPAVLQYVADLKPEAGLAPAAGSYDRYLLQSWLNYIGSEIHKQVFAQVFNPASPDEAKAFAKSLFPKKTGVLENRLSSHQFLVGDRFTVADAYLAWALMIAGRLGFDLQDTPALAAYAKRIHARPAYLKAIGDEMALLG